MLSAFLITLREGIEAALVVAIILAYLARTGNRQAFRPVWLGTSLGIMVSLAAGGVIFFTAGELAGRNEEIFEGAALFLATGLLTWMIFWMRRQAAGIKGNLQLQVAWAMEKRQSTGLVVLTFTAVAREGVELALFLFATTRLAESPALALAGSLLGLAFAVGLGYSIYKGSSKLNLSTFFSATSILLIIFGAGLFARGVHEFNEAGLLPPLVAQVWNINNIIPEKSIPGRFLSALFGYNGNPSLSEVIGYWGYLLLTLGSYFRLASGRKTQTGSRLRRRLPADNAAGPDLPDGSL